MKPQRSKASAQLGLDEPDIEKLSRLLAEVYRDVSISRDPVFSWLQIVNDATILGENLRRDQREAAASRAGKILMRLVEFTGYFNYAHEIHDPPNDFSDVIAGILRTVPRSRVPRIREGLTAWVLRKYPHVCAKCGHKPCECCLEPWVIENRREDPEKYFRHYGKATAQARRALASQTPEPFTIRALFDFFKGIYANTYYHEDPWKIGMHLSEELGEATIELSRIWLAWRAGDCPQHFPLDVEGTFVITRDKADRLIQKITNESEKEAQKRKLGKAMDALRQRFDQEDSMAVHMALAGDRLKEEIADSLSWLCAVFGRLDPTLRYLGEEVSKYSQEGVGGVREIICPWCHERTCTNSCLMMHSVSSGIVESIAKF